MLFNLKPSFTKPSLSLAMEWSNVEANFNSCVLKMTYLQIKHKYILTVRQALKLNFKITLYPFGVEFEPLLTSISTLIFSKQFKLIKFLRTISAFFII